MVADAVGLVVVLYTAVGGLKATFLTDYVHTTVALILLTYFVLGVLSSEHIGGISGLYEKLKASDDYIEGNYMGSLLSMKSKSGTFNPKTIFLADCHLKPLANNPVQRFYSAWC